jgi:hypothetical protein
MQWHSRSFMTVFLLSITVRFAPYRVTVVPYSGFFLGQEQGYAGGSDPANREAYASSDGLDRRF